MPQCFSSRIRLDQILIQAFEHSFERNKILRLIIYQKDLHTPVCGNHGIR